MPSWDMYDPRTTIKAEAVEAIAACYGCYIASNGKAYLCDDSVNNQVHGVSLKAVGLGEKVTLVTHGRLNVDVTQTIGNKANVSNQEGGGVPGTDKAGSAKVGFAIAAKVVMVHIEPQGNNS